MLHKGICILISKVFVIGYCRQLKIHCRKNASCTKMHFQINELAVALSIKAYISYDDNRNIGFCSGGKCTAFISLLTMFCDIFKLSYKHQGRSWRSGVEKRFHVKECHNYPAHFPSKYPPSFSHSFG